MTPLDRATGLLQDAALTALVLGRADVARLVVADHADALSWRLTRLGGVGPATSAVAPGEGSLVDLVAAAARELASIPERTAELDRILDDVRLLALDAA